MRIELLSTQAQEGLRRFCAAVHDDELMLDAIASLPEQWAWIWFQLREAEDRLEWFPKGKWATIQVIEETLRKEAQEMARGGAGAAS